MTELSLPGHIFPYVSAFANVFTRAAECVYVAAPGWWRVQAAAVRGCKSLFNCCVIYWRPGRRRLKHPRLLIRDEEPSPPSPPTRINLPRHQRGGYSWFFADLLGRTPEELSHHFSFCLPSNTRRVSTVGVKQYFFNPLIKLKCEMTAFPLNFAIQQRHQQQQRPQEEFPRSQWGETLGFISITTTALIALSLSAVAVVCLPQYLSAFVFVRVKSSFFLHYNTVFTTVCDYLIFASVHSYLARSCDSRYGIWPANVKNIVELFLWDYFFNFF